MVTAVVYTVRIELDQSDDTSNIHRDVEQLGKNIHAFLSGDSEDGDFISVSHVIEESQ